jgi:hypothetical protein
LGTKRPNNLATTKERTALPKIIPALEEATGPSAIAIPKTANKQAKKKTTLCIVCVFVSDLKFNEGQAKNQLQAGHVYRWLLWAFVLPLYDNGNK